MRSNAVVVSVIPHGIGDDCCRDASAFLLLTIPRARTFLIEDMCNGGGPNRPHGICEVKLNKGKTVYEGSRAADQ
jgi:hypothetical protein